MNVKTDGEDSQAHVCLSCPHLLKGSDSIDEPYSQQCSRKLYGIRFAM